MIDSEDKGIVNIPIQLIDRLGRRAMGKESYDGLKNQVTTTIGKKIKSLADCINPKTVVPISTTKTKPTPITQSDKDFLKLINLLNQVYTKTEQYL